jgi:hypothetical protein
LIDIVTMHVTRTTMLLGRLMIACPDYIRLVQNPYTISITLQMRERENGCSIYYKQIIKLHLDCYIHLHCK